MPTRVSNLASNKLIQSTILRTQDRIADRQLQISTLQKSQDYAGIADESNRLVTLEASKRRVDQYLTEGTNVKLRMQTMLNSIDSLKTTLKDIQGMARDGAKAEQQLQREGMAMDQQGQEDRVSKAVEQIGKMLQDFMAQQKERDQAQDQNIAQIVAKLMPQANGAMQ